MSTAPQPPDTKKSPAEHGMTFYPIVGKNIVERRMCRKSNDENSLHTDRNCQFTPFRLTADDSVHVI